MYVGPLPFGYERGADGVPEPVDEEASAVGEAFEIYAAGDKTHRYIADWFNARGFRTRNTRKSDQFGLVGPRPFTLDSVRTMLSNPFYLGQVKWKGELYPGKHQAIVSQELFDTCAETRRKHFSRPRSHSEKFKAYLLSSLARCAFCGERMWASTGPDRHRYYRDSARRKDCTAITQASG